MCFIHIKIVLVFHTGGRGFRDSGIDGKKLPGSGIGGKMSRDSGISGKHPEFWDWSLCCPGAGLYKKSSSGSRDSLKKNEIPGFKLNPEPG